MDYKDILGELIEDFTGCTKFSNLDQYHEYWEDIEIDNSHWVKNSNIILDGYFNANQLEALALFLRDKNNE